MFCVDIDLSIGRNTVSSQVAVLLRPLNALAALLLVALYLSESLPEKCVRCLEKCVRRRKMYI